MMNEMRRLRGRGDWRGLVAVGVASCLMMVVGCRETDPPAREDTGLTLSDAGGDGHSMGGDADGECRSTCESSNQTSCGGEFDLLVCEEVEPGCLQYRPLEDCRDRCAEGVDCKRVCRMGACVEKTEQKDCVSKCEADKRRCDSDGRVVRCEDFDDNGCTEWGGAFECEGTEYCDDRQGKCVEPDCSGECSFGETACEEGLIKRCEKDARGCLEFSAGDSCPAGDTCKVESGAAQCVEKETCTDECTDAVCGSNAGIRRCEDVDNDGCLELTDAQMCGSGKECRKGECVAAETCQDRCPKDEVICVGNRIAECKDHDNDGCLEFNQPRECPGQATCTQAGGMASCSMPQPTGKVVINEIFYNPYGKDVRGSGSAAYSPTFVELHGPSGMKIGGFTVKLIDGITGQEYGKATLPAGAQLDGGGYAVLTMKSPGDFFIKTAPTLTNVYKVLTAWAAGRGALQHAPSSIILETDSGKVDDAVGYGFFSSGNMANFKGEMDAALPTVQGRSIGRNRKSEDTDRNLWDFDSYYPTPGLTNSDLLINEIYVDQPGHDDGSMTFVELAAPIPGWENVALDGYILHAINGLDGKDYIPAGGQGVKLFGKKLHDGNTSDGYFVICNESAAPPPSGLPCNQSYKGVDFQNGPDNFVLTYYGRQVDAVGYGTFLGSGNFKGEGSAASFGLNDAGKSLGRWPLPNLFFDLNNNLLDFWKMQPTPGAENVF